MTTFLTVLFGSGIGTVIVTVFLFCRRNEIDHLQQQLAKVYGPLYYFTSQNRELFELHEKYMDAHRKEPSICEYAKEAKEKVREQKKALIDAANSYVDEVVKNNLKVMDVLRKGWHLIDPDDVEVFAKFQVDYIRFLKFEDEAEIVQMTAQESIGDISYMRVEMVKRIKNQWSEKKGRVEKLRRFPWMRRPLKIGVHSSYVA